MALTLAPDTEYTEVEAVIDLENGTWTCTEHGVTMDIASGDECPECPDAWRAPPDLSGMLVPVG